MQNSSDLAGLIRDVKEHVLFLQELGVETLSARFPDIEESRESLPESVPLEKFVPPDLPVVQAAKQAGRGENGPLRSRLANLPSLAKREPVKPVPDMPSPGPPTQTEEPPVPDSSVLKKASGLFGETASGLAASDNSIEEIRHDIGNCVRCPLHQGRTQIVHTAGNFEADLMFVGEAPGADEDEQGFPFVGRAGQLLTKIIEGIGFKREEVCIGNINRCRPPGNRAPTLAEAETCKPFLLREIAIIKPKVVVVLGNTATQNLLNTKIGITRLRGEFQDYHGVKVMPTFHPAYLLRDPNKKREVWEDMKKVRDYLASTV